MLIEIKMMKKEIKEPFLTPSTNTKKKHFVLLRYQSNYNIVSEFPHSVCIVNLKSV